jgi:hypothetical protein
MQEEVFVYRRTAKRLPCFFRGSYISQGNISHAAVCNDISSKGAGVTTSTLLPLNTQVKMKFDTGKINPLLLEGRVCWCRKTLDKWQAGIVFNRDLPFDLEKVI